MNDNLPPNNKNQQPDNSNPNPPQQPVTPPVTKDETSLPLTPEIPETPVVPPTEKEEIPTMPEEEETKPEIEPKESPIEIGSLEEPSFTAYKQDTPTTAGGNSNNKKGKKLKTMASVLGLLLIIVSLPLTVVLVKQRQEIRKEATEKVEPSGSANVCGVLLSATHSYNNGRLTTTFNLKNTRSDTASFEFHTYSCVCSSGYQKPCGRNSGSCSSTNNRITLAPGGTTSKTVSAIQPAGDCGSFQNDGFIIAVNGNQNCSNN
jgi:hypothetical protein